MCGPTVTWDWFILDFAYVLVLISGALVLRARGSGPGTWLSFGLLSTCVGAFLFHFTWKAQTAFATVSSASPTSMLMSAC